MKSSRYQSAEQHHGLCLAARKTGLGAGSRPRLRLLARGKDAQAPRCLASAAWCLQLACGQKSQPTTQLLKGGVGRAALMEEWILRRLLLPAVSRMESGEHRPGGTAAEEGPRREGRGEVVPNTGVPTWNTWLILRTCAWLRSWLVYLGREWRGWLRPDLAMSDGRSGPCGGICLWFTKRVGSRSETSSFHRNLKTTRQVALLAKLEEPAKNPQK